MSAPNQIYVMNLANKTFELIVVKKSDKLICDMVDFSLLTYEGYLNGKYVYFTRQYQTAKTILGIE